MDCDMMYYDLFESTVYRNDEEYQSLYSTYKDVCGPLDDDEDDGQPSEYEEYTSQFESIGWSTWEDY